MDILLIQINGMDLFEDMNFISYVVSPSIHVDEKLQSVCLSVIIATSF